MPISNLSSVRRSVPFIALSFTLRILEKVGLMRQPLQTEALLASVRRQTGLDDFGDEAFLEPLRRLLDSCQNEAHLNTFGKCALTQDTLQLLINRLQIQRDRGQWPRIAEEAIIAPLFITGLPRTGTTLLHGLLAQDHDLYYAPATWEVMFPSPSPSLGENKRIKRAEIRLAGFDWLAPEFRKIHPVSAHLPQECIAIMSHTFMSDQFPAMYNIPAYLASMASTPRHAARLPIPQAVSPASAVRPAGSALRAQGSGPYARNRSSFLDLSRRSRGADTPGTDGNPTLCGQSDDGASQHL